MQPTPEAVILIGDQPRRSIEFLNAEAGPPTQAECRGYYRFITVNAIGDHYNAWRPAQYPLLGVRGHASFARLVTQMYFQGSLVRIRSDLQFGTR